MLSRRFYLSIVFATPFAAAEMSFLSCFVAVVATTCFRPLRRCGPPHPQGSGTLTSDRWCCAHIAVFRVWRRQRLLLEKVLHYDLLCCDIRSASNTCFAYGNYENISVFRLPRFGALVVKFLFHESNRVVDGFVQFK